MGEREVGGVDSHALTLEQPQAKTLELARAMLAWKEHSMAVEALRWPEHQPERARGPCQGLLEEGLRTQTGDLVFAAQGDMCRDEGGLNGVEDLAQRVKARALGCRYKERELPSAVRGYGHDG